MTRQQKSQHKVHIIELGYCGDGRKHLKFVDKEQQHIQLKEALEAAGWQEVTITTILFGACGTIYADIVTQLEKLDATCTTSINRTLNKLNVHTVKSAYDIICNRRHLESRPGRQAGTAFNPH